MAADAARESISNVATTLLFACWVTMNPDTRVVLEQIEIDAIRVVMTLFIVLIAPGLAAVFFPALAGVAITSILWGVVHLTFGFLLAAIWMRVPIDDSKAPVAA